MKEREVGGIKNNDNNAALVVAEMPVISEIYPLPPTKGGTITIIGQYFYLNSNNMTVAFDGTHLCTNVNIINETCLECNAPVGSGKFDLTMYLTI